jgi:hypothetical protein
MEIALDKRFAKAMSSPRGGVTCQGSMLDFLSNKHTCPLFQNILALSIFFFRSLL